MSDAPVKVLIDARNVQRSRWPNLSDSELVELAEALGRRTWARARDRVRRAALRTERSEQVAKVPTTGWLAKPTRLAEAGEPFWLVTSDRELRERAGPGADKVVGGGTFVRELTSVSE